VGKNIQTAGYNGARTVYIESFLYISEKKKDIIVFGLLFAIPATVGSCVAKRSSAAM
jgi:hypothetical protein